MKKYDEIKDIIVNKLGIKNLEDYKNYTSGFYSTPRTRFPNQEEIEQLSPDVVDNYDFWKVAEELFGTDPVCNCNYTAKMGYSIMDCNRNNLRLAESLGGMTAVRLIAPRSRNILEIGAGYGSMKNWIETNTYLQYTGVDVFPKIPFVERVTDDGVLTQEQKSVKYDIIYSCNVFQHLSPRQFAQYCNDAVEMLNDSGIFYFSTLVHSCAVGTEVSSGRAESDGQLYLRHYGQFTRVPYVQDLINFISSKFDIYSSIRNGDDIGMVCAKKTVPPATKQQKP